MPNAPLPTPPKWLVAIIVTATSGAAGEVIALAHGTLWMLCAAELATGAVLSAVASWPRLQ